MFCTKCGHELKENQKFCPKCGNKINQSPLSTSNTPPAQTLTEQTTSLNLNETASPENNIPTFAPPSEEFRTFAPPPSVPRTFDGPSCHYHSNDPAVSSCAKCGNNLCTACTGAYEILEGPYAGRHLCYDCCSALVEANVAELQQNYSTIRTQFILWITGVIIGAFIGLMYGASEGAEAGFVFMVLFGAIGGGFVNFVKRMFSSIPDFFVSTGNIALSICVGLIKFLIYFLIYGVMAFFETVKKLIYYVGYLKKTSGFIEADKTALAEMRDYMEYTLIRSQNVGIDLEQLMHEGSELFDNTFAQAVQSQGLEAAEANLSHATTTIAENGEIIRSFSV